VTAFNKVYNSDDGSYYSLKHYLETMSYGSVTATGAAFPRSSDGQSYVSVALSHPENYYKPYSATNTIGYTTAEEERSRENEMLTEAFNGAKAQIGAAYTGAQLDVHGSGTGGADGSLDAVTFAYLPEKTDTASGGVAISYADLLWPHKSTASASMAVDGCTVSGYSMVDASEFLTPSQVYSSTVIHEFLHILGMPDLYRYTTTGYPLYNYDVMAFTTSDAQGEPQSLLQYNIRNMLGFAPALSEITATTQNVTLNAAQYASSGEQSAVIIRSPYSSSEEFVVEMKQSAGVDEGVLGYTAAGGLLVYRVNLNVYGNASGPPDQEYVFRPGDTSATATGGQPFYAVLKPTAVNGYRASLGKSRTDSTAFDNGTIFFSDGTNSGITISNLRASGSTGMTFDVTVQASAETENAVVDPWKTVDGKTYYIHADGSMATGKTTIDGAQYIFDADGVLQTGDIYYEGNWYYAPEKALLTDSFRDRGTAGKTYYNADGLAVLGWNTRPNGDQYYQELDKVYRVVTGTTKIDGSVYFFGTDGKLDASNSWHGDYYAVGGKAVTGKTTIDGAQYIFDADGVLQTGDIYYEGNWYYAPEKALLTDSFRDRGTAGKTYYNADGLAVLGWNTRPNGDQYYQELSTVYRVVTGTTKIDGSVYFFGTDGKLDASNSWHGDYYAVGGKAVTGKMTIDGAQYIFDADGVLQTGDIYYEGNWYYAPEKALLTDSFRDRGTAGKTYYNADGLAVLGWNTRPNGDQYYQELDKVYRVVTGTTKIDGSVYFFGTDGKLDASNSWHGDYYAVGGKAVTGKTTIDGAQYIFGTDGVLQTGDIYYEGNWYYAPEKALLIDGFRDRGGGRQTYYNADGLAVLGWNTRPNGDVYYQKADSIYYVVKNAGIIEGKLCFFDANGKLDDSDGWHGDYYVQNKKAVTGKVAIDGAQYIFGTDGVLQTGDIYYEGYWYYAPEKALLTDGLRDRGDGKQTYYNADGLAVLGWNTRPNGDVYYQRADGIYVIVKGASRVDGQLYLFGSDGILVSTAGWHDSYYVRDGKAVTGKTTIDGAQYIFGADGVLQTGDIYYEGNWYYAPEKALLTDSFRDRGTAGKTYYNADGLAVLGWNTRPNGDQYYQELDKVYRVVTGTTKIDGSVYFFGTDGKLDVSNSWHGNYYAIGGKAVTGKTTIDGAQYIFGTDGVLQTGDINYAGNWYYAPEKALLTDGFRDRGSGAETYYSADGTAAVGWITYSGADSVHGAGTYFQLTSGSPWCVAKGTYLRINNVLYYFESSGLLFKPSAAGFYSKGGHEYYYQTDGSIIEPPTISSVDMSAGSTNATATVTIQAKFTGAIAAALAYSFDGGATWQASASKEFADGTTIAAGQLRIRDVLGYTVVYDAAVTASSGTVGFGIDVSAYQGVIDWAAMKASGVRFAMIRAVSWKNHAIIEDPYFRINVRNAKANGIYVGAYIYSYAYNLDQMKGEVDKFSAAAAALKAEGYTLDMPVFIDYEDKLLYTAAAAPSSNEERTNIVRYGMQLLQSYGYSTGFYTYYNFARDKMNGQQLINEGYDFWLAHWNVSDPGWSGIEMWQYGTANVGGIAVDGNVCYKNYTQTIHGTGGGTHVTTQELFKVYDVNSKQVVEAGMESILSRMVANEIGTVTFSAMTGQDRVRAYQAQAVAAHSWLMYQYANGVITPSVGLRTLSDTYMNVITPAVSAVANDYIMYDNQIAFTPYFACSGGSTNNSADYWGKGYSYLTKVDCGDFEDKLTAAVSSLPKYRGAQKTRTAAQLRADILAVQPSANLSGDLSTWIVPSAINTAGYYTKVSLGGVSTSIPKFCEGVTGPYSANFSMQVNSGAITFSSYGYGHGVGMSQYAMLWMARTGSYSVAEILQKFYPGTTYKTIS
jgi:SpoIID/LytB domain protein/M6 family metalloprotease-like protein